MVHIPDMTERYPEGMRMYYEHESDDWDDWDDKSKKKTVLKYNGIVPYSKNGPYTVWEINEWGAERSEIWSCKTLQDARMVAVQYFKRGKRPDRTLLKITRDDNPRVSYIVFNMYHTSKEGKREYLFYYKNDRKLTREQLYNRLYYLKGTGEVGAKYKKPRSSTGKAKTR